MAKKAHGTREINDLLRDKVREGKKVRIGKEEDQGTWLKGNNAIAVGLEGRGQVVIHGKAGDYFGALNLNAKITLIGSAGSFLGDSMEGGDVAVAGDVGAGSGYAMRNGRVFVRGTAGGDTGALMEGGVLVVDGNVGDTLGRAMRDGTIVVTGNIGKEAGKEMRGGKILVGGEVGGVANGAKLTTIDETDKKTLLVLKQMYKLKKKTAVFEKIIASTGSDGEMDLEGIEMG